MNITNLLTTDWFVTDYAAALPVISWDTRQKVGVKLFSRTPSFTVGDGSSNDHSIQKYFKSIVSLSDLLTNPEWVPCTSAVSSTTNLYVKRDSSTNKLNLVDSTDTLANIEDSTRHGWVFTDSNAQEMVSAAVMYLDGGTYDGRVLFATTQGIGPYTVAHTDAIFGQSKSQADPAFLLKWIPVSGGGSFNAGCMLLYLPLPQWEPTHTQHLWIQPQRVNLIANPSFELAPSPPYWRATNTRSGGTVTLSRSSKGISGPPYCGTVSGSTTGAGFVGLESNFFPKTNNWHSVSFYIRNNDVSSKTIKFGLVGRTNADTNAVFFHMPETSLTASSDFQYVKGLFNIPDDISSLQFRIEFSGGSFSVDNVLVDPHEGQYDYFDGNSIDGLDGDFRWMGGASNADKQFSTWYNNFVNTKSRLIGAYDDGDNIYKAGLLEEWVPTGSNLVAHWDAVTPITPLNWIGDAFYPIVDLNGTSISTITTYVNVAIQEKFPPNTRTLTEADKVAIDSMG